jgi:ubiquinone/menaquinone biosynthesis C-methylase UbiE
MLFDPGEYWESLYQGGHGALYPWDEVVSFVFRQKPKDVPHQRISILEVGCGIAPNLWFAAREGFKVAGVDISQSAISVARKRFEDEGLTGDFRISHFFPLPFADRSFDMVIDRAAMTYLPHDDFRVAVSEIRRVIKSGGSFFSAVYSGPCHGTCRGSNHFEQSRHLDFFTDWNVISLETVSQKDNLTDRSHCIEMRVVAQPL